MTPPPGPAAPTSTGTSPSTPVPAAPTAPIFNHLEILGGGRIGINDTFQLQLGLEYRPIREVAVGLNLFSNFSNRPFSGTLSLGGRIHFSDAISLQPTGFIGLGFLNHFERTAGRLAEDVSLTGLTLFGGLEARFMFQPLNWLGFYVSPGITLEGPIGVGSSPSNLVSGENPVGGVAIIPTINLGIVFGVLPNRSTPAAEPSPPPSRPTEPTRPADERARVEADFERRVAERMARVTEGLETARRERVEAVISEARGRIQTLRRTVNALNDGINRSNRMSRLFDESAERLADPAYTLSVEDRRAIQSEISALSTATELDSANHPVSTADQSEAIRSGLRFLNPRSTTQYGQRVLRHLTTLRDQLNRRGETALAQEADQAMTRLTNFTNHSEGLTMESLENDARSIQASMDAAERVAEEYHLGANPAWTELRSELSRTRDDVALMMRHVDALTQFGLIFNGSARWFIDQVDTPERAAHTFGEARHFLETLSSTDRYRGVTLEALRERYSDFFNYLGYNLNVFIRLHTPPVMSRVDERRRWFPVVQQARDLLCQIEPAQSRCRETLESPPAEAPRRRRRRDETTSSETPRRTETPPPPPPAVSTPTETAPPPPPPPRRGRDAGTLSPDAGLAAPPPPPPPPPSRRDAGSPGTESVPPPPPPGRSRRPIIPPSSSDAGAGH